MLQRTACLFGGPGIPLSGPAVDASSSRSSFDSVSAFGSDNGGLGDAVRANKELGLGVDVDVDC